MKKRTIYNTWPTRSYLFGAICLAALGVTAAPAQPIIYPAGATIHGKRIGDWIGEYFAWTDKNPKANVSIKDYVLTNQTGPLFFTGSTRPAESEFTYEVPVGVPIYVSIGGIALSNFSTFEANRTSGQRLLGSSPGVTEINFALDGMTLSEEELHLRREDSTTGFTLNGSSNAWAARWVVVMQFTEPGEHLMTFGGRFGGQAMQGGRHRIKAVARESQALELGIPYRQNFDSLGPDSSVASSLPLGWSATDKNAFALFLGSTNAVFPPTSPLVGKAHYVFNAGNGQDTDRGLAIAGSSPLGETLQFLATAPNREAKALELQFSVEAWSQLHATTNNTPGEASFDILIDIYQGAGFVPLANLSKATTGPILPQPVGDSLDGNDPAHRMSYRSGVLPLSIPADARLRIRWISNKDADPSDGWIFGLDDVSLTLHADANGQALPPALPTLDIAPFNGKVTLSWSGNGVLQSAEQLSGPWLDQPEAVSPRVIDPTAPTGFFRLARRAAK